MTGYYDDLGRSDDLAQDFWSRFPETEAEFMAHVRDPGIHASVKLEFSPDTRVKSQYGGRSASKMRRLVQRWRADGEIPDDVDRDAVRKFESDVEAWDEEYREAVERARASLPEPPFGCHWSRNTGGLLTTRRAGGRSVPTSLSFRLWRNDLGYMPGSE